MSARRYSTRPDFSIGQTLLIVAFAAILMTLFRLLYIYSLVTLPHFIFWDYWCLPSDWGVNLNELFRLTFLLAGVLVVLVAVSPGSASSPCWSTRIPLLLTASLLISYAALYALLFEGPLCAQAQGIISNKFYEALADESDPRDHTIYTRPEGRRPLYCGWERTCWVEGQPHVIYPWRSKEWEVWNNWSGWYRSINRPRTADWDRKAFLATPLESLLTEVSSCIEDARNGAKPDRLTFGEEPWWDGGPDGDVEWEVRNLDELFLGYGYNPIEEVDLGSDQFRAYKQNQTNTIWVPMRREAPPIMPWLWGFPPMLEMYSIGRIIGGPEFVVCTFMGSKYDYYSLF